MPKFTVTSPISLNGDRKEVGAVVSISDEDTIERLTTAGAIEASKGAGPEPEADPDTKPAAEEPKAEGDEAAPPSPRGRAGARHR